MPRSDGFDFIVVGAGSAQPDKTVLLIEAGGDDRSVLIRVPGMVERVIESRRFDWHHAGQRGVAAGVPAVADYNEGVTHGTGVTQASVWRGRRHSAADAFLRPALRRRNLVVASRSMATRLLLRNGRCHGVECLRDGVVVRHEAQRGGGGLWRDWVSCFADAVGDRAAG